MGLRTMAFSIANNIKSFDFGLDNGAYGEFNCIFHWLRLIYFNNDKVFLITTAYLHQSINQGPRSTDHCRPTPSIKSKADGKTSSVTPICGPRSMGLGSGKVEGKVLKVNHM